MAELAAVVTTVQILLPDAAYSDNDPNIPPLVDRSLAQITRALKPHGLALIPVPLTEAKPVAPTLALLAWGYHLKPERWRKFLQAWPAEVPLLNSPALLEWNTDKHYLAELERAGVPIVPTHFVPLADDNALEAARTAFASETLIVKPRISAGAYRTAKVKPGNSAPNLADAMIQPFLPSVPEEGELSLIYFDGTLSHALRKRAADGDFRVQEEFGATNCPYAPDAEALAVAGAALAAAPQRPAYARADLVRLTDGRLALMELELIDPELFLDFCTDSGALPAAVRGALGRDR